MTEEEKYEIVRSLNDHSDLAQVSKMKKIPIKNLKR